jgi:broad specificity phosphatase PhoE
MRPAAEPIFVVRHARPLSAWPDGDPDPGLDELGLLQAEETAAVLQQAGVRRLASSPFRRCRETAEALARRLRVEVEIDEALGEIPQPDGLRPADRSEWLRHVMSGSWRDLGGDYLAWREKVAAAIAARPGAALFTHFVALNAAASYALGDERVRVFDPDHASVSTFALRDGALQLVQLGRSAATKVL